MPLHPWCRGRVCVHFAVGQSGHPKCRPGEDYTEQPSFWVLDTQQWLIVFRWKILIVCEIEDLFLDKSLKHDSFDALPPPLGRGITQTPGPHLVHGQH